MSYTGRISSFSIVIVFTVLTFIGIFMMPLLAVKLLPEHALNSLVVHCSVQDRSPEATELQVTSKLENAVSGLPGIKQIRSVSSVGSARVFIILDKWVDPAIFRLEASSLLRQLYPQLPPGAGYPNITVNKTGVNSAYDGFLVYELYSPDDAQTITQHIRQHIQPLLSGIKNIQQISITGANPLYWELTCNDALMQQFHINTVDIYNALNGLLTRQDAGIVKQSGYTMHLIKSGNTLDSSELLQLPVKKTRDRLIRLGDVATLRLAESTAESYQRINGQHVVLFSISAAPQANIISLKRQISKALESHGDSDYHMQLVYDATEYLQEELNSLYIRTGLSVIILLLFVWLITRKARRLLIIILSMAVNIFISFIGYYIFHLDIHLYSLAGITISVGLTIDNCVIIMEDLEQREKGGVFFAILASTLTAVIALSAIFLLDEKQQEDLADFAIAILINIVVSLPVVFLFIPSLYALLEPPVAERPTFRRIRKVVKLQLVYENLVLWLMRHRKKVIISFILFFGFPVFLVPDEMEPGGDFANWYNNFARSDMYQQIRPVADKVLGGTLHLFVRTIASQPPQAVKTNERPHIQVEVFMPPGNTLAQMNDVTLTFEKYLSQFHEIAIFKTIVSDAEHASISIYYKPNTYKQFPGYLKKLLEEQAMYSGAADFRITGVGNAFNNTMGNTMDDYFIVKGYNYAQLYRFAEHLKDSLKRIPRVNDILFSPFTSHNQSVTFTYDLRIRDKQLLHLLNVSEGNLSDAISNSNEQLIPVNDVLYNNTYLPLKLHSHHAGVIPLWNLIQAPTFLNDTQYVRIGNLASVEKEKVNQIIIKEDHAFVLNVLYRFTGSFEQNQLMQKDMLQRIRKNLPYGYHIEPGNNYSALSAADYSRYCLLIALFIFSIYLVCAILLESLLLPLAVILMIPFSFIGVFITFYYLNIPFGDGGYASLLMLCGIVTNGALYVVNDMQYLQKERPGLCRRKIFLKSFMQKGVPIFITTISAVLSMLPFMLDGEEQGFWYTLSVGMAGGLLFSFVGICLLLPLCLRLNKPYDEVLS